MTTFNKGDVSEGILAASITARFISKTKTISNTRVGVHSMNKPTKTQYLYNTK